jgi:dienelactone hydrolase
MKTQFTILLIAFSFFAQSQTYPSIELKAKEFSEALVTEDFKAALEYFTPTVAAELDAAKLKETWKAIQDQMGDYVSKANIIVKEEGDFIVSFQPLKFKTNTLDLKLIFDASESIAGILFTPHKILELDLVETELYAEEEILVESGSEIQLRGILTLPKNKKKVPAVVLVHGSGPNDMDETYGPNKLFRDIAQGLAEKGIAVIRYTKRTKAYSGPPEIDINTLTLYEETIEDALSAVNLAKKDKRIDKKNIFVLGHSLGAMSAPRIGTLSKSAKGIIIMAGNARPLEELVYEQYNYLINEDSVVTPEEESIMVNFESQLKALKELSSLGKTDGILPFGLPSPYWQYLGEYNQVESAQKLDKPIMIIQGKRDYQVPLTDYEIWQSALAKKADVTFKIYEKLNHQMREGTGKCYPAEYNVKSDLPFYLIVDIAEWIFKQK